MKKFILLGSMYLLPVLTFAQGLADDDGSDSPIGELLKNILEFSNTILIPFIIGIGFLVFVYGMFQYFILGGANDDKKKQGKSLMIYATLGFVLIVVFWGVVNLIANSTGLQGEDSGDIDVPQIEVPA